MRELVSTEDNGELEALRQELEAEQSRFRNLESETQQKIEEAKNAQNAVEQRLQQLEREMKGREELLLARLSEIKVLHLAGCLN